MTIDRFLTIEIEQGKLFGHLTLPESPRSVIIVPRSDDPDNIEAHLLPALLADRHGVLRIDLLTHQESGSRTLASLHTLVPRLFRVLDFARDDGDTAGLPLGIFAIGPVGAAALRAAAERDLTTQALAVADGVIDHAGRQHLQLLVAPLLVLLGENEDELRAATERAFAYVEAPHALHVGDRSGFAPEICSWFNRYLRLPAAANP